MRNHFLSQPGWRDAPRNLTPAFPLVSNERREVLSDARVYRVGKGATAAWEAARRTEARRQRAKRAAHERYERALEEELLTVDKIRGGQPILLKIVLLMLLGAGLALVAQAVPWSHVGSFLAGLFQGAF